MNRKAFIAILCASIALSSFVGFNNSTYEEGKANGYDDGFFEAGETAYYNGYSDGYYIEGIDFMISRMPETFGYDEVEVKPVTLSKLKAFLADDDTDKLRLSDGFNCLGFAFTLKANADKSGILCGLVTLYLKKETGTAYSLYHNTAANITLVDNPIGHALNAFMLNDGSIVFVEPQSDYIITNLYQGQSYAAQSNSMTMDEALYNSYIYGALEFSRKYHTTLIDDIVDRINIFWGHPYNNQNQIDYK